MQLPDLLRILQPRTLKSS